MGCRFFQFSSVHGYRLNNAPHHKGLAVLVTSAAGWQRFDVDPDPNLKLLGQVKSRPYLANIRISKHTQDKSRVTFFCKFLALLCF